MRSSSAASFSSESFPSALTEASSLSSYFSKASIASRSKLFFGGGLAKSRDVRGNESAIVASAGLAVMGENPDTPLDAKA